MRFILKVILFVILPCSLLAMSKEESDKIPLTQILSNNKDKTVNAAETESSKTDIPAYTESGKSAIEDKLNYYDPRTLAAEGAALRDREIAANPDGVVAGVVNATSLQRVKGYENYPNLKMFKDADTYMMDPVSHMERIEKEGCKETENNREQGFRKREWYETYTDTIEEQKSCESPITKFSCEKSLRLSCTRTDYCDYGGIERGSVASDMKLEYSNGVLTIGTIADNYWNAGGEQCVTFDRMTTFNTKYVDLINEFKLKRVGFDDYIQVSLNGNVVYVGPYGGRYIDVVTRKVQIVDVFFDPIFDTIKYKDVKKVNNGINDSECELSSNWVTDVDVDLKPFLKEGENVLRIKVIVTGQGEGWVQIHAKQQCCAPENWKEEWISTCQEAG